MKKILASLLLFSFLIVSLFACSSKDDTTAPVPQPPSIFGMQFRADAGDTKVTLDWKMLADATSYNIYYISSADKPDSTVMKASGPKITGLIGPSHLVTGLSNTTKYWFALSAVNANGESDLSSIIPATPNNPPPPAAPTNIRVNPGNKMVTVTWTPVTASPAVVSYNLHCLYFVLSVGMSIITIPGQSASSYVVNTPLIWNIGTGAETTTPLANEIPYTFWLTAETAESGSSTEVLATPGTTSSTTTVPDGTVVTSISATTGTTGQITISWDPLPGETPYTSYNLYYYPTIAGSPTTRIPEFGNGIAVAGPTITDGTSYSFHLTSVTSSRESFAVTATPSANTQPAVPFLESATAGDGKVTLTWTAVTGATSYNIYWSTLPDVTKTIGAATIGLSTTPLLTTATVTLTNGTTYYFVVTAVNANGESMESNEKSATPVAGS